MNDDEFREKIYIALDQKPTGFDKALKTVKEGLARNVFALRGLTYDFDPENEVVTILCHGAVVGIMTQPFFECLARYKGE